MPLCLYHSSHIIITVGVTIIGNEAPLTIGSSSQIMCSSDLNPLMIEWLHGDTVLVQAEGEHAYLTIPAVNDSLHGQEYHCKATTPYGVLEKNITISTTRKLYCIVTLGNVNGFQESRGCFRLPPLSIGFPIFNILVPLLGFGFVPPPLEICHNAFVPS